MRTNSSTRLIAAAASFSTALLAVFLGGCGQRPTITEEQPFRFPSGLWETVWVNPQIVLADSLVTLIRAERIDSLPTEPADLTLEKPPAIGFAFLEPVCNVAVNLLDEDLRLLRPLLVRKLPAGYYRLTLNLAGLRNPPLASGTYFLRADYCGRTEMAVVTVR